MKKKKIFQDINADNRLNELGLETRILTDSLQKGYVARTFCNDNDAPMFAGITQWNYIIRSLREHLIPKGWKKSDKANYCRVISPCGKFSISIFSGCVNTGISELEPTTRNSKGSCTEDIVKANCQQLNIFHNVIELNEPDNEYDAKTTWILLYYTDNEEIRAELSLPKSIKGGFITGWSERIILPSQSINNDPVIINKDPDFGPEIEIELKRKSK